MSSMSRLSNKDKYSAGLSSYVNGNSFFNTGRDANFSRKSSKKSIQNQPKIQFRKILLSRNNHSKVLENQLKGQGNENNVNNN